MRTVVALATVAVLLAGCAVGDDAPTTLGTGQATDGVAQGEADQGGAEQQVPARPRPSAPPDEAPTTTSPLLQPAAHGDGDSWRDTAGTEYRLGLVNAPELDECFGAESTAERRRMVGAGFRADVYTVDQYGRGVSVVTTAEGVNLNVHLAEQGFVDDRYLADFRHENPELAVELDAAFAEARAQGRGLWSACAAGAEAAGAAPVAVPVPVAAPAAAAGCHPDYDTCIPLAGDGSGNGRANDLDCGDVPGSVRTKSPGADPYRLDADGDGVGCDS